MQGFWDHEQTGKHDSIRGIQLNSSNFPPKNLSYKNFTTKIQNNCSKDAAQRTTREYRLNF